MAKASKGSKPSIGTVDTSGRTAAERMKTTRAREQLDMRAKPAVLSPETSGRFRGERVETADDRVKTAKAQERIGTSTAAAQHKVEFVGSAPIAPTASSEKEGGASSPVPPRSVSSSAISGSVIGAYSRMSGSSSYHQAVRSVEVRLSTSGKQSVISSVKSVKIGYMNGSLAAGFRHGGSEALGRVQGVLGNSDDTGLQAVAMGITSGKIAVGVAAATPAAIRSVYRGARDLPKNVVQTGRAIGYGAVATAHGVKVVGKGIYEVSTTVGKASLTVGRTVGMIASGQVTARFGIGAALRANSIATGLSKQAMAQRLSKFAVAHFGSRFATQQTTRAAGIAVGKGALAAAKRAPLYSARGLRLAGKGGLKGIDAIGMALAGAQDETVKGLGDIYQGARVGVKGARLTTKVAYRGGKKLVRGVKFIKGGGIKRLAAFHKTRYLNFVHRAGRNVKAAVAAIQNGGRVVAAAVRLAAANPVALIGIIAVCVVLGLITSAGSGVTSVIGATFSGGFTIDNGGGDLKDEDFITWSQDPTWGLPKMREDFINETVNMINSQLKANGGAYDYYRVYGQISVYEANGSEGVDLLAAGTLSSVIMDSETMAEFIQPLFISIVLQNTSSGYSEAQAKALLQELFDKIFVVTQEDATEWCWKYPDEPRNKFVTEQHFDDCGFNHARTDCPNSTHVVHTSYTDHHCDSWQCGGHYHPEIPPDPVTGTGGLAAYTSYCGGGEGCSTKVLVCSGSDYCNSHLVLKYYISSIGIYDLKKEYFDDPIADLEASGADPVKLGDLKTYREMIYEMLREFANRGDAGFGMEWTGSGTGVLGFPVTGFVVTTEYGVVDALHPSGHTGIDFAASPTMPLGTPVHAAEAGTVTIVQNDSPGGYGLWLEINHGGGIKTRYAHNMSIAVRVGEVVKRGDVIAYAGSTGHSTGVHVHFEVYAPALTNPRNYLESF